MNIEELERFHAKKKKEPEALVCRYPPFGGVAEIDPCGLLLESKPETSCNSCIHWGEHWEKGEVRTCIKQKRKTHIVYTCEFYSKWRGSPRVSAEQDPYENFID